MKLELTFRNQTRQKTFSKGFFVSLITKSLSKLGKKLNAVGLSITLVSPGHMRKLNRIYRSKDMPTDVLSFNLTDHSTRQATPLNAILELGDLFLCIDVMRKNALKSNTSLMYEIKHMTVHGLLHLLGYDHENSEREQRAMEKLEKQIINFV